MEPSFSLFLKNINENPDIQLENLIQNISEYYNNSTIENRNLLLVELPNLLSNFCTDSTKISAKFMDLLIDFIYKNIAEINKIPNTEKYRVYKIVLMNLKFEYYQYAMSENSHNLLKLLIIIYTEFDENFTDILKSTELMKTLPILLFKNACFLASYPKFLIKNESIKKCLYNFLSSNKIREAEFYYLTKQNESAEWLGFFNILSYLYQSMREKYPSISDFIGQILYKSFTQFLEKILPGKTAEFEKIPDYFKILNEVLIIVSEFSNEIPLKLKELSKIINVKYLSKFGKSKQFREQITAQLIKNSKFVSLKIFEFLNFKIPAEKTSKARNNEKQSKISDSISVSLSKLSIESSYINSSISDNSKIGEEEKIPIMQKNHSDSKTFDISDNSSESSTDEVFKNLDNIENTIPDNTLNEIHNESDKIAGNESKIVDFTEDEDLISVQKLLSSLPIHQIPNSGIFSESDSIQSNQAISLVAESGVSEPSISIQTSHQVTKYQDMNENIEKIAQTSEIAHFTPAKSLDVTFLNTKFMPYIQQFVNIRSVAMKPSFEYFQTYFIHQYFFIRILKIDLK